MIKQTTSNKNHKKSLTTDEKRRKIRKLKTKNIIIDSPHKSEVQLLRERFEEIQDICGCVGECCDLCYPG